MSILFVSFRTYFDDSNHMKLGIDLGTQGQGRGQEGGVINTHWLIQGCGIILGVWGLF